MYNYEKQMKNLKNSIDKIERVEFSTISMKLFKLKKSFFVRLLVKDFTMHSQKWKKKLQILSNHLNFGYWNLSWMGNI